MEPIVLSPERREHAATLLARAFHQDAGTIYLFPQPDERARFTPAFFAAMIQLGLKLGTVRTIGEPLLGVAVWAAPSEAAASAETAAHGEDLPEEVRPWPPRARERLGNLLGHLDRMHARLVHEPHWQLLFLGIAPENQGQGWGSALIRPMLAEIDAHGLPCTLQTLDARNLPFYERHGFRVVEHGLVPDSDVPVWEMRRG